MRSQDPRGYYSILGVALNADAAEIKIAYRRKAMELHPDRNKAADATAQFQLVKEAYAVLSNPETRARYDTATIETSAPTAAAAEHVSIEAIACSCCQKVTAQPRYCIFFEVKSFLVMTTRSARQGVFCSACASKAALRATAITWLLGWWGLPWGPIYSIQAIFTNLVGGKRPADINARIATHQAWAFAAQGKVDLARAVAEEALDLAKKVSPTAAAKAQTSHDHNVEDERVTLRQHLETLLRTIGPGSGSRLKNPWRPFGRTFQLQAVPILAAGVLGWHLLQPDNGYSYTPQQTNWANNPYSTSTKWAIPPQSDWAVTNPEPAKVTKPSYVRPSTAPNGQPWPPLADYVKGYPKIHANGFSTIKIDNSQNNSDVFVKLAALTGGEVFPVRTFFIPAHSSFTLTNVTPGEYDIRYRDLSTGRLSRSESFELTEERTPRGVQYSNLTMTLFKVQHGNMQTYGIAESDF